MNQNIQKSIVIVDDTPDNLRLLIDILGKQGYRVRPAPNGELGLASIQKETPDLILLDILMPGMDGFEVCRQLKADEELCDIPVIFISALNEVFDKVTAFAVGGVDYITKPFQVEEVLARVNTHLTIVSLQKNLQTQVEELNAYAHTVAHDLKNPIGGILGYASLLLDDFEKTSPEETKTFLAEIIRGSQRMSDIIDALLLLASVRKLDKVDMEPLNMGEIVQETLARLTMMIDQNQVEITMPEYEDWPVPLGYAAWIEEVWANYISNAIKYGGTPPRIELGATVQDNDMVCFWIRDNGPGISADNQERLFTQFTRLDKARAEGHGLGLSIVKRIVEKLGGQVGVESTSDEGSVFSFILPALD
jgi:two-component system, sensor histidine kinase and response regulator